MSKFFGVIGFAESEEVRPGVWDEKIVEHSYYGDVTRNSTAWTSDPQSTNDDLKINCQISIVADRFADQKAHSIKYVEFMGAKWKITSIEPKPPRLLLTLGGVYNG